MVGRILFGIGLMVSVIPVVTIFGNMVEDYYYVLYGVLQNYI